jgi:hypothetical protein
MKHLRTEMEGSRKRQVYDQPATPFERLKRSGKIDLAKIQQLEKLFLQLDPFALKKSIEAKLKAVLRHQVRPTRSQAA